MRRKNRKWVALAIGTYLLIIVSAFRWSQHNRLPGEPSILVKRDREVWARMQAERAEKAKLEPHPQPTGEPRLRAAGPAYVAARYDATHVVFIVATDTEARFSSSPLMRSGNPTKISAPARPAAPLAGLQELWEPDQQSLHFFPRIIQTTQPGDQWRLDFSPGTTIPVTIERPIIAPTGCFLAMGFLASVPPDQRNLFASSRAEYFVVRSTPVESADAPVQSQISELPDWNVAPAFSEIEQQLTDRMKQELTQIDGDLIANAGTPGARANEMPIANPYPRLKEWLRADQALLRGEGKILYDVHAFSLTPDSTPRLYVRARWTLAQANVFLMTAWFKADAKPVLLSADVHWSKAFRNGEASDSLGDTLNFQTILNYFDADHDGWAELLMHTYEGSNSTLALYLYTDQGLVPMKMPLTREAASADSCLDP